MNRFIRLTLSMGFLVAMLFLGACEKLNSKKHFVLDDYFRSYFNFKNGSEWVYRNAADTSKAEKVYVSGYVSGKMVWDAFDQEFIQYDLISDVDSVFKIRAIADDQKIAETSLLVRDTFFRIAAQWFYVSNYFSGVSGTGDTFTFHPTYVVGNVSYADVIEMRPANSHWFKAVYMARNVGIIRKDLLSGKSYVLKSYHVQ